MRFTIDDTYCDSEEDDEKLQYLAKKFEINPYDESVSAQAVKESFDIYIHKILYPNNETSLQDLKLDLNPDTSPAKQLEFIISICNIMRNEIFPHHVTVSKEIKLRYRAVGLCLNYQSSHLKALTFQKSQLQEETLSSSSKCKELLQKNIDIKKRVDTLLLKLGYKSSSTAEQKTSQALLLAHNKTTALKKKLEELNTKADYYFLQVRKPNSPQNTREPCIQDVQKESVMSKLKSMESDIANLVRRMKMLKTEPRNSFSL